MVCLKYSNSEATYFIANCISEILNSLLEQWRKLGSYKEMNSVCEPGWVEFSLRTMIH